MRFRKLRIAWSVGWGIICLALSAAYFTIQYQGADLTLMRRGGPGPTVVEVYKGKLSLSWEPRAPYRPEWAGQINRHGFRYNIYSDGSWNVWAPLWVVGLVLPAVAATLAALPWIRSRFSFRTLLIATTLVAVGLGVSVWLSARPPAAPAIDQVDVPEF